MNASLELLLTLPGSVRMIQLSHPMDRDLPQRPGAPSFTYQLTEPHGAAGSTMAGQLPGASSATDEFTMRIHTGTHVDSLGHVAYRGRLFDGSALDDSGVQSQGGGVRLRSMESLEPILARGVLYDFAALLETNHVPADYVITPVELARCARREGVNHRAGDVVLFRTGWDALTSRGAELYRSPCPGPNADVARGLVEGGVRATGSDTFAFEEVPGAVPLEPHVELIAKGGVFIFEMLDLRVLAAEQHYEFVFFAAPLRIVGATGSPVNPIALIGRR